MNETRDSVSGWKRTALVVLVCVAAAVLSNGPLLFLGRIWPGDDLAIMHQYADQFGKALREGQVYPRWLASFHEGLGSPVFVYYQPLYFYAVYLLRLAVPDPWASFRVLIVLVNIAAGLVAYRAVRLCAGAGAALAGAVALIGCPMMYHIPNFHNLFPWHAGAVFLLLAFYYAADSLRRPPGMNLPLAFALAAVVFTHTLSGFMLVACLPFILLPRLRREGAGDFLRRGWWFGLSLLLGLGLSMIHLLPVVAGTGLIDPEACFEPFHEDWRNTFILPLITRRLFGMRWFSVQWLIGGLAALWIGVSGLFLFRAGRTGDRRLALPLGWFAVALVAAWLAGEGSFPLWKGSEWLQRVGWPYRFLPIALFGGLLGTAWAFDWSWRHERRALLRFLPAAVLLAGMGLTAAYQVQSLRQGARPRFDPEGRVDHFGRPIMNYWMPATIGPEWASYSRDGGWTGETARNGVHAVSLEEKSHRRAWRFTASAGARLRLPLLAFPAWAARLDGEAIPWEIDAQTGVIVVSIPPGESILELYWAGLPQERLGAAASGLSLAVAVGILLRRVMVRRVARPPDAGGGT